MRNEAVDRLERLRAEYAAGERLLVELEARQASLRQSMLRISGAIQVLEELLTGDPMLNGQREMSGDERA